jgi:hypothetical protein
MGSKFLILYVAMPIIGGLIAMSAVIARKRPDAQKVLNKLLPYKASIGAAMLGCFVLNLYYANFNPLYGFGNGFTALFGVTLLAVLVTQLFLGLTMGAGQIAKWARAPEHRTAELQRKLLPFEVPLGAVAITSGVLALIIYISPKLAVKTAAVIDTLSATLTAIG